MRNRFRSFTALLIISVLITGAASAHSGRTDSSGGHYNRSTGEYHYHHGHPAHQHENGICPYDDSQKYSDTTKTNTSTVNTSKLVSEAEQKGYEKGKSEQLALQKDALREQRFIDVLIGAAVLWIVCAFANMQKRKAIQNAVRIEQDCARRSSSLQQLELEEAKRKLLAETNERSYFQSRTLALQKSVSDKEEIARQKDIEIERTELLLKECRAELSRCGDVIQKLQEELLHERTSEVPFLPNTFGGWGEAVHRQPNQQRRIQRALHEQMQIVSKRGETFTIKTKSRRYETSLNQCTCFDFTNNTKGKAPCSHIYFLAYTLGYPIDDYLTER